MTEKEKRLWDKIAQFEINDPHSSFTFTDRLARENDWTLEYSVRAIDEYKRFLFLICATNTPKTPSEEVDQVWHLHLIYTQSYWLELCRDTLNQDIHHGPTKGREERTIFIDYYAETLKEYEAFFGYPPPVDIWPPSEKRFKTVRFTRVNRDKYWLIKKPNQ